VSIISDRFRLEIAFLSRPDRETLVQHYLFLVGLALDFGLSFNDMNSSVLVLDLNIKHRTAGGNRNRWRGNLGAAGFLRHASA